MQGCSHSKFLPTLRQYLLDNKSDVVGLVEPHISGFRADRVIASYDFFYFHRVEAAGFSEGTLIYDSPNASKRKPLWSNLSSLASNINQPWLLFGDFNATLSVDDRLSACASSSWSSSFSFFQAPTDLTALLMHDIDGPPYCRSISSNDLNLYVVVTEEPKQSILLCFLYRPRFRPRKLRVRNGTVNSNLYENFRMFKSTKMWLSLRTNMRKRRFQWTWASLMKNFTPGWIRSLCLMEFSGSCEHCH
ncbi:hypothetical protein V6N13_092181 [Hibiscus sabdariffa]